MGERNGTNDVVFKVHEKYYKVVGFYADLLVLENVVEYKMETTASQHLGDEWSVKAFSVDPRLFGLGCARARTYGIAIRKSKLVWSTKISIEKVLEALKQQPLMQADDFFFLHKTPQRKLTDSEDTQWNIMIIVFNFLCYSLWNM